jgi:hypothetical protein
MQGSERFPRSRHDEEKPMNENLVLATRKIARRQRGLFTYAQALEAGWNANTLRAWHAAAVIEEPEPRVYRFAGVPLTWEDRLMALALSANATAARRSACALYQLLGAPKTPHVLLPRGRRNLDRAVVHSSNDIAPSDLTIVGCIPVTSPVRSIIDTAGEMKQLAVNRLVDKAVSRQLVRVVSLERRARELRAPGRPGAARVLMAVATAHPDLERARNEYEAAVLRICDQYGLPYPIPNHEIVLDGHRRFLDTAWPESKACLEFDGYITHIGTRVVFDDDRARQNALVDAGWKVFRITSTMLDGNLDAAFAPVIRAVRGNESHGNAVS